MEMTELIDRIVAFRDARDWKQFHSPDQLATAISIEAAEIQEHFLWKSHDQIKALVADPVKLANIGEEVADTLILTLLLAHDLGLNPGQIIAEKLAKNEIKYPVEKARGRNTKYTEL